MKPKIFLVHDHRKPEYWLDGFWAALELLKAEYDIYSYNVILDVPQGCPDDADIILAYGGWYSEPEKLVRDWKNKNPKLKVALSICGNSFPPYQTEVWDLLFFETKWYRPQINFHPNIFHAYGTNTDIFFPSDMPTPIVWDYIGVGAFAKWKRWEKMLDKKGTRLIIGEYQENNEEESLGIIRELVKGGVAVMNMVHPFDLANLYHWSRTLYMPADINGGGERAIFEAKSCGLNIEVEDDNPKLKEIKEWDPVPDQHWYAKQLKIGINSIL